MSTEQRELTDRDRAFTSQVLQGADAVDLPALAANERTSARERLDSLGIPRPKDEEWRFVDLRPITSTDYVPVESVDGTVTEEMVDPWTFDASDGRRLVVVNGEYRPELSETEAIPEEVRVGNFATLEEAPDTIGESFGGPAQLFRGEYFANLNMAGYRDGVYVNVPSDTSVDGAIQILHLTTESSEPFVSHPRTHVHVGTHSNVSIVEEYGGPDAGTYFNNTLTEVSIERGAHADHVKVQGESRDAFHIGRTAIDLDDHSTYNSKTISYGAAFSRYDVRANGDGEEINCTLDGLAVLDGDQESDTHSVMDHREPNAGSHQLHKMILDDKAHAVFNGKIYVQPYAQKIDAYQLNRSLLLSDRAKVNTKPQLEIFADDVSCTHGATIGQVEEDQLYYLRTRGIDRQEAREILIYGFAAEIIETIPIESLRRRLRETISRKTRRADSSQRARGRR